MGLFDRFRKSAAGTPPGERSGRPASGALLGALKMRYALTEKAQPADAALSGDWWEGKLDGRTLAFDEQRPAMLVAYLGEIVEVTSIYLVRPAPGKDFRLGASVAPAEAQKLDLPPIRDGKTRLSASVQEVAIYENDRGISLRLGAEATLDSIAADLAIAQGMLSALEKAAG